MNNSQNNDNDNLKPIVLGTVKKGKTGKPVLAIIIILLLAASIYFLPIVGDYFKDNSIIDLILKGELIDYIKNKNNNNDNKTNLNNDNYILINGSNTIENKNIKISNLSTNDNVLSYKIKSKTATYDASKENLYLQIYVDKKSLVYTKILDDVFTINEKEVKENINFYNDKNDYYAILKIINIEDINDVDLSSDESGLSSIVCSLNNETYEYIFQKKELIEINRSYQYKYNSEKSEEYQIIYKSYNDLKNEREKFNINIELIEDYIGFTYKEKVLLEQIDASLLGKNYYTYKTQAKEVKFKQEAKGFDCE